MTPRPCANPSCGSTFVPHRALQKYCSQRCRERTNAVNWRRNNLERAREKCRRWRKENAQRAREHQRKRRERHPDYYRDYGLRRLYGLSLAEYRKMAEAQDNACAICRMPETATSWGRPRALSVDHDHATGRIRGLLCSNCNTSLKRHLAPSTLRRMADYLERAGQ